jgi:hypothetical protein
MPRHAVRHRRAVDALTVALGACRGVGVRSKSTFFQIDVLIRKLSRRGREWIGTNLIQREEDR